ncbi:LOW QUALITY PROTEIN: LCCL domain-containing protein / F5/8 type C domain-containing protein, putative [Eimeria mitis]|uniref:LCCL domain-containing protein / F5/8 type C domain-containing protein, putative n=1 Tax=Eimeria mitis TaxID=44415 RepID=U6KFB6_9EIME|nr:LOW QUALITY PROTEIN: LCCL domain-containing protein / F5/8 type C domain-containing protein, putative [Eimeria mitis]CDJ36644.1 LCCL domain-containing protein / F5/8 type C domain-containing protein, putative [Eimeria mitis]
MRLSKISEECPEGPPGYAAASASSLHAGPLTSFVELTTRIRAVSPAAAPAYDPALAAAEEAAKERINPRHRPSCCHHHHHHHHHPAAVQTHGIDPVAVKEAKTEAGITVGGARQRVKPTEQLNDSVYAEATELNINRFREVENLTTHMLTASADAATRLQQQQEQLQQLEETHVLQRGYESYKLTPTETTFEHEFLVQDCTYTREGPSHWGFAPLVATHKNVFGQSTPISGPTDTDGTFAILRRRSFYDFVLTVQFLAMGSGSVGIGFRMKDRSSGYLLLLQQKSGSKKLLRLDRGEETTIAERRDGGYVQGEWHRVRIEAAGGRIKICVGEENETEAEVLT